MTLPIDNLPERDNANAQINEALRHTDFSLHGSGKLQFQALSPCDQPTIRLCHLLPGTYSDLVEIRLVLSGLDAGYETLSYCWGQGAHRSRIYCEGQYLEVTENLHLALRRLRLQETERVLWIDAVCINQEDVLEKERQVSIMCDIYRKSERTVVWLGEDYDNSIRAMQMLHRMNDVYSERYDGNLKELAAILLDDNLPPQFSKPNGRLSLDEFDAVDNFLRRPYFRRAWIAQEIAVAGNLFVRCGQVEMGWDELIFGCYMAYSLYFGTRFYLTRLFIGILSLASVRQQVRGIFSALDLQRLLLIFRESLATDPRDKVYSLLGITTTDLDHLNWAPDYQSSTMDVYLFTALTILRASANLDILSVPRNVDLGSYQKASWAPDWSDNSRFPAPIFSIYRAEEDMTKLFSASKDSPCSKNPADAFNSERLTLSLDGHFLDVLLTTSDILPTSHNFETSSDIVLPERATLRTAETIKEWAESYGETLLKWDKMAQIEDAGPYFTGEDREIAFLRTMTLDYMPNGLENTLKAFNHWKRERFTFKDQSRIGYKKMCSLQEDQLSDDTAQRLVSHEAAPFLALAERAALRRLARTEKGYLGLVPPIAQPGDAIALLKGARVPIILRQKETAWELIGDSYIHGVMFGEAFEEELCHNITLI